jgi:hypothetical protein
MTISSLFSEIKRQTGTVIIFNAGDVPPEQTITLPVREGSLAEILNGALPYSQYAWQRVGSFIVVRTLPINTPIPVSQPTREEFESDVAEYTRRNIEAPEDEIVTRYDTIRTEIPHSGLFSYPEREFIPVQTYRPEQTYFSRQTPPIFAVKTNLLWWAARGTFNLGGEIGLGKRTSLEFSGGINRWNLKGDDENNKKLTHWILKPEFRYWLCERFNGHFLGLHAIYAQYNVGDMEVPLLFEKEYRYEGIAYGGGINYGYHLPLSKRWGLELTAGVGVARMDYTQLDCPKCGSEVGDVKKTWFGPTELGVKLIFMIR